VAKQWKFLWSFLHRCWPLSCEPSCIWGGMENGAVAGINKVRSSCLMPETEWVLSAAQLETLGGKMSIADASVPLDLEGYAREDVYLDIEFKFTQVGQLFFKQVRSFLRSGAEPLPTTISDPRRDLNRDGIMNVQDLEIFPREWHKFSGP
jgi:hypothetical protein